MQIIEIKILYFYWFFWLYFQLQHSTIVLVVATGASTWTRLTTWASTTWRTAWRPPTSSSIWRRFQFPGQTSGPWRQSWPPKMPLTNTEGENKAIWWIVAVIVGDEKTNNSDRCCWNIKTVLNHVIILCKNNAIQINI